LLPITILFCIQFFFFFQAEDGIRVFHVTGVQTCALPISALGASLARQHRLAKRQRPDALLARLSANARVLQEVHAALAATVVARSEEHTSELQSRENLVCRLLLEKKKNEYNTVNTKRGKI